jgi:VIT1/CCC1 family predicted Fe2+/Mn2+ transporter
VHGRFDDVNSTIPATRLPGRRRARGAHPASGDALRARVLGERGRIERLSRIRELVLGFPDDDHPEIEQDARSATLHIASSRRSLIKTKVEKELGLPYGEHETALGDAIVVGLAYALAALIPLWPYLAWDVATALPISLAATAVALFGLGVAKGKVARMAVIRSGLQVLLIGGASAGIGYLIGVVVAA